MSLRAAFETHLVALGGGQDDTAGVNAALAALSPFGVRKRVILVGDFTTSAPLRVLSRTILDASAATITLAAASNCNMLNNTAISAPTTAADGAITTGTTTLTRAVAGATVGQSVKVAGAAAGGYDLVTIITAVSGTTLTLAKAATTTVTGAAVTTWARETVVSPSSADCGTAAPTPARAAAAPASGTTPSAWSTSTASRCAT